MKIQVVNALVNILSDVKIMKVEDKRVRTTLLNDYLHLRGFAKDCDDRKREVVDKFNTDWKGTDTKSGDYQKALAVLNDAVGAILNEDVYVALKPIPVGDFMAIPETDSLTLEQLAFLLEQGVLEKE